MQQCVRRTGNVIRLWSLKHLKTHGPVQDTAYSLQMCRIRARVSIVGRRKGVLRGVRGDRNSADVDPVHGTRRASDDRHVVHVRRARCRSQPLAASRLRETHSRLHHLLFCARRRVSGSVSCLHHRRNRLELPRRVLLLLHLDDDDWTRRLHSRRPATAA